jgi:signal transduction histidine kinase
MTEASRTWSLRRRILMIASLASLATLLLGGVAMYVAARAEDETLLDTRLADLGRTILSFSEHEIGEILAEGRSEMIHVETAATLRDRYHYQIWAIPAGTQLLRSHNASGTKPMAPLQGIGFSNSIIDNEEHRVFSLRSHDGTMLIQVAECLDERESAVGAVSFYFLLFLVVPFAVIGFVTWWLLNRSLRAIDGSARELASRSPIDLSPLQAQDPPQELRPMIDGINGLMDRIREAMSMERGFTAVAAHELRSPLAGLRAQAQLASMSETADERNQALAAVMGGVDRCAHMLEQLLDLTRVEAHANRSAGLRLGPVSLERVLQHALADLHPEIERRQIALTVRLTVDQVNGLEWGLVLLLRNLVSNAVRHTPPGSRVVVASRREGEFVCLTVDDSGSGIALQDRQRVFERFERLGRSDTQGVGLGMSIVRSVVESHMATIHLLESPLGGLQVKVLFSPEPASDTPLHAELSAAK